MTWNTMLTWARVSVLGCSVLLLSITTPLSAQTTIPAPDTPRVETQADRDYTGLWGLLGLLGLAGLARRQRTGQERVSADREPLHTETRPRR